MSIPTWTDGLRLHVLGSGNGRPGRDRDTSGLLVLAGGRATLIDCPGGVVSKLARLHLEPEDLTRVVLTHDHVDHVYGLPHLLHALSMRGVMPELPVYAPAQTLALVRKLVAAFGLDGPRYPTVRMHPVALEPGEVVLEDEVALTASPARHSRPTLAIRVARADAVLGLSSDSLPSEAVARLCAGADLLVHDCGGLDAEAVAFSSHHASAAQAARVATQAAARRLLLTHLPPAATAKESALVAEARRHFSGSVALAHDGDCFDLGRVG